MDIVGILAICLGSSGLFSLVIYLIQRKDKKDEDRCGYAEAFITINEKLDRRKEENQHLMEAVEVLLDHCADGNHTGECKQQAEKLRSFKNERMWN